MNSDKILNFLVWLWSVIGIIAFVGASFACFISDLEGCKKVFSIAVGIFLDLIAGTIILMLVTFKKEGVL